MKRLLMAVLFLAGMLIAQVFPPDLGVRDVTLLTTTPIALSERQQIIRALKSRKQERASVENLTGLFRELVKDQFQLHGYFKAELSDPEIRIVQINPQREVIDLTVEVKPGDKYPLGSISFQNERAFPVDRLRHQFAIADGDMFDVSRMRDGLEELRKFYNEHGYINSSAVPNTTIDETNHTIAIEIDIDEGHTYHTGKLIIDGDEWRPGTKAKLLRDWKKYQGRPFRSSILRDFLNEEHASPAVNPDSLFRWETINATPVWPNLDSPPYTINFRMTLANPTSCRPAPSGKMVRICQLAHPDRMPPAR